MAGHDRPKRAVTMDRNTHSSGVTSIVLHVPNRLFDGAAATDVFTSDTALLLHFDGLAAHSSSTPICPYCGEKSVLEDRVFVYGPGFIGGKVYVCSGYPKCDAYVGATSESHQPLGTLANAKLRELRGLAHLVFAPLWKAQANVTRNDAYRRHVPTYHSVHAVLANGDQSMRGHVVSRSGSRKIVRTEARL